MASDSVEFFDARNGSKTVRINGNLLHSSYNPEQEAERFVRELKTDFIPSTIVILEPGLSYAAQHLRNRFPEAKIGCIRYCSSFESQNFLWDFVFQGNTESEDIFNFFGEEKIFSTLFIEWPSSAKIFPEKSRNAWLSISSCVKKARDVLGTREYFSKRWTTNKILFFKNINKVCTIKKGSKDIFIAASGPSLESCYDILKTLRKDLFIIALSSALLPLLEHDIKPDLCISTDGGWWAKKHIDILIHEDIPIALPGDASCPQRILKEKKIIPLCYEDDLIGKRLFQDLNMDFLDASRNGTVSGTALELAMNLTSGKIFFGGLDLMSQKTFQHAKSNRIELHNCVKDFRLSPCAKRITPSSFPNQALKLYESWFSFNSNRFKEKVFRIKGKSAFKNHLGSIKELDVSEMENLVSRNGNPIEIENKGFAAFENRNARILETIQELSGKDFWLKEQFPSLYILSGRTSENENILTKINEKNKELLEHIYRLLK